MAIDPFVEPNPVVRVEGLNFSYGEGDARNQVLFDINLTVEVGEVVVVDVDDACTTGVAFETAVEEPPAFDAVTETRSVSPCSADVST